MKTVVCVVNWNGLEDTKRALESLRRHAPDVDIYLLENGSGQQEMLKPPSGGNVRLFVSDENLGFSGGNNLLIREAIREGYNYVYLLNNDAVVTAGFLDEPLKIAMDSDVGFIQGKIAMLDGKRLDNAGHLHLNTGDIVPRGRGHPVDEFNENDVLISACAAGMLLKVEMLKHIGLFDESFFINYEDADLTYRATMAGWRGVFCASSIIHHRLNASIDRILGDEYYVRSQKNAVLAYFYNTPGALILINLPFIMIKYMLLGLLALIMPRKSRALFALKALLVFLSSFRYHCVTRRNRMRLKRVKSLYLWKSQFNFLPSYLKLFLDLISQRGGCDGQPF